MKVDSVDSWGGYLSSLLPWHEFFLQGATTVQAHWPGSVDQSVLHGGSLLCNGLVQSVIVSYSLKVCIQRLPSNMVGYKVTSVV